MTTDTDGRLVCPRDRRNPIGPNAWSLSRHQFRLVPATARYLLPEIYTAFFGWSMGRDQTTRTRDEASVTSAWTVTSGLLRLPRLHRAGAQRPGMERSGRFAGVGCGRSPTMYPNWEPCRDGTAAHRPAKVSLSAHKTDLAKFEGWDTTRGPSGACGVNQWLVITMPFTLTQARIVPERAASVPMPRTSTAPSQGDDALDLRKNYEANRFEEPCGPMTSAGSMATRLPRWPSRAEADAAEG